MRFEISRNNKLLMKQQERLSTGLKNPRVEDDAASFSLAAKLNARIAGLGQAEHNVADVKGTAEHLRWVSISELSEEAMTLPIDKVAIKMLLNKKRF